MFLKMYLSDFNYNLLLEKYTDLYINSLDENNFRDVYLVFKKYNFYFIEDIIINYLEIFELDSNYVEKEILKLKEKLGAKYIYLIGNDMRYLSEFINNIDV